MRNVVNMITKFDHFISPLVNTSMFKTSLWTYNLIRYLASTVHPKISMKTYHTVHYSICPFNSKRGSSIRFVNLQNNEQLSSFKKAHHTLRIMLQSIWAIKDVQNPLYYKQPTLMCNFSNVPDIYNSQVYPRRTELYSLHAFIPVLHDNDIDFSPNSVCFRLLFLIILFHRVPTHSRQIWTIIRKSVLLR